MDGADAAYDTGGTVVTLVFVIVPVATAVLLLALPGARAAGSRFVGWLAASCRRRADPLFREHPPHCLGTRRAPG